MRRRPSGDLRAAMMETIIRWLIWPWRLDVFGGD